MGWGLWELWLPKEAVEVPMSHVLEDHGQGLSIGAHTIETYYVLVLENCQKFGLALEVLSCRLVRILQSLMERKMVIMRWLYSCQILNLKDVWIF